MKRMVKSRNQDADEVQRKISNFLKKRSLCKPGNVKKVLVDTLTTPLLYDDLSNQHKFVGGLVPDSFDSRLQIVYKSRNKVSSVLCPKRKTKLSRLLK